MIFHITTADHWQFAQQLGQYQTDSLTTEGFIHASEGHQVLDVANAFYRGQDNLVVLKIDPYKLNATVRWEAPVHPQADQAGQVSNHRQFPHIYGTINLDAVSGLSVLVCGEDGRFVKLIDLPVS
ncbi:MAG: DUF952 domain-containing protein [Merismopediaceae bacterium]|nr:DUF952 domain-containing protein [Merismopediaceae bacterium]